MAGIVYDSFLADVFNGACNTTHTYRAFMVTAGYVEDRGAHSKRSAASSFEVSGTGYTAGGALVVPTFSINTTTHKGTLTIPAVSWPSSSGLAGRKLIVYRARGGSASADELVCCIDPGANLVSTGILTWNPRVWEIPLPPPI